MKHFLRLFRAEATRMRNLLPGILARTAILTVFILVLIFCGKQLEENFNAKNKVLIGVTMRGSSTLDHMAISYMSRMEGVSKLCRFQMMSEEEGRQKLKDGTIAVWLDCPAAFIQGIMNGTNEPISIYFRNRSPMTGVILREILHSSEQELSMAQVQIYAAEEFLEKYGFEDLQAGVNKDLNMFYMDWVMSMNELFDRENVGYSNDVTLAEHILSSGIVLFLLLWGMNLKKFLTDTPDSLSLMLRKNGYGTFTQLIVRFVIVSFVVCGVLVLFLKVLRVMISVGWYRGYFWNWESMSVIAVMISSCCIAALLIFCYELFRKGSGTELFLFGISLILTYVSGGFLPKSFLPEVMDKVSMFFPVSWLIQTMEGICTSEIRGSLLFFLFLFTVQYVVMTYLWKVWLEQNWRGR